MRRLSRSALLLITIVLIAAGCQPTAAIISGNLFRQDFTPGNTMGQVMILEWHRISSPEGRWQRTPDNFRKDLELLYQNGYSAVSLDDYVSGTMHIPAGRTPVVLTFDDGTEGQFRYIERDGQRLIDPDCAVGIMLDFYRQYPDFGLEATFFVNARPFEDQKTWQEKVAFVIDQGMNIEHHTWNHVNLSTKTTAEIEEQLGKLSLAVHQVRPDYDMHHLALPFGIGSSVMPFEFDYQDTQVVIKSQLLVGSGPAPSPFSERFDPLRLPRIQVFEQELPRWLAYFDRFPEKRYVQPGIKFIWK